MFSFVQQMIKKIRACISFFFWFQNTCYVNGFQVIRISIFNNLERQNEKEKFLCRHENMILNFTYFPKTLIKIKRIQHSRLLSIFRFFLIKLEKGTETIIRIEERSPIFDLFWFFAVKIYED